MFPSFRFNLIFFKHTTKKNTQQNRSTERTTREPPPPHPTPCPIQALWLKKDSSAPHWGYSLSYKKDIKPLRIQVIWQPFYVVRVTAMVLQTTLLRHNVINVINIIIFSIIVQVVSPLIARLEKMVVVW